MKQRLGKGIRVTLVLSVCLALFAVDGLAAAPFADMGKHWARGYVQWAVDEGIAAGYEDGTFRPNAAISEREFIALVFRAYPAFAVDSPAPGEPWYKPYYDAAEQLDWPVSDKEAKRAFTRGDVATIIVATRGQLLDTREAVQYLLDHGLSEGRTSATVEGYEPDAPLTRAEAVTFLYNVRQADAAAGSGAEVPAEPEEGAGHVAGAFVLNGVALGDSEQAVLAALGSPDRRDPSHHGYTWLIYKRDYAKYAQIGIHEGRVVALYSNAGGWEHAEGIKPGASYESVAADAGVSAQQLLDNKRDFTYEKKDMQITVYFDWHLDGAIEGMLVEKVAVVEGSGNLILEELAAAYERQIFDQTNAFRLKLGMTALEWDDDAATSARLHSADMAAQGYFSHDSLDGTPPWDRMAAAGVPAYALASENIAAGYLNAFSVHAGWVNSAGHRENLLHPDLTMLGVGVQYDADSKSKWYYTQNFYTPR